MPDFEITGVEELVKRIKQTDDKLNRKLQLQILKDAGKPMLRAAKAGVEDSDEAVKVRGYLIPSGTLRKSIGFITGKNKEWPTVYIGARVKGAYSGYKGGWYAHFVHEGHNIKNSNRSKGTSFGKSGANPYQDRAFQSHGKQAQSEIEKSIIKAVKKGIEKGQL